MSKIGKRIFKYLLSIAISLALILMPIGELVNAEGQEVELTFTPTPKIDVSLAKANTSVNLNNFQTDLLRKLREIGVDTNDVKISAIETVTNQLTSQTVNVDQIINSWQVIGADTWTSTNGQIYSSTGGGQSKPAWWGTALIDPNGYESQDYSSSFTMVSGGQLNEGVCFNVTRNSDGSLNGYFVSVCNHLNSECRLWRFDHYTLDQAFDKGINAYMWCHPSSHASKPDPNSWVVNHVSRTGNDSFTCLAGWTTNSSNVKYDISYKNGLITIKVNNAQVASVRDTKYQKGTYGFWGNNCEMATYMYLRDIKISTVTEQTKNFSEILREPDWREGSYKFLTYVDDKLNSDLSNASTYGELITRLMNEGIHFLGWGTNTNKSQLENIVKLNDNKGFFTSNTSYTQAIQKTAEYIKSVLDQLSGGNYLIVNEPINIKANPSDVLNNTIDDDWKFGKWKLDHDYEYFENNIGQFANSGKYLKDFVTNFDKVGKFNVTYKDSPIKPSEIYVHRRPSAQFNITRNGTVIGLTNLSVDQDKRSTNNGIKQEQWKWIETTGTNWNNGKLNSINTSKDYIIQLGVQDFQNVWAYTSKYLTSNTNALPIAMFDITNNPLCKYETLEINDSSYDPAGGNLTTYLWELYKDGRKISSGSTPKTNFRNEQLGKYTLYLTVTNARGKKSETFGRSFEVIDDTMPPEVVATPTNCDWQQNVNVNLSFTDKGGSLFRGYVYAITDSQATPNSWSSEIKKANDNISITQEGTKYLHIKAYDNAGNCSEDRILGPYNIDHSIPEVNITADLNTITTNHIDIKIDSTDMYSGIKKVTFNGQQLNGTNENLVRVNKNGIYNLVVEDNAGNIFTQDINVTNIYCNCEAGLDHPIYSSDYESCPICDLIAGIKVTKQSEVYNSHEKKVTYTNTYNAQIVELYNGEKIYPVEVDMYQFELKVKYQGNEYNTGIKGNFEIIPKTISIVDIVAIDREYNGTNIVELRGGRLVGVEQSDLQLVGFNMSQTGTIPNKNVGTYNVAIPEITLSGDKAKNYTLTQPDEDAVSVNISKKKANPNPGPGEEDGTVRVKNITAINRQYNGTDVVEINRGELVGIEESDKDKVDYILSETGTIPSKDVGTYNVSIPEIVLVGEEAQNYEITQPAADEISVEITKKDITITGIKAIKRAYDSSNIVELEGGDLIGIENIDLEKVGFILSETGTIPSKDVGTYNVSIPEISLIGEESKNYLLAQPKEDDVKVTITQKRVSIQGITATQRQYDSTKIVQIQGGELKGIEDIDLNKVSFTLSQTGTISNKDVGTYNVKVPEITLEGNEAKNYNLVQPLENEVIVKILPKVISIEGITATDRQYDGTNIVEIQNGNLIGIEEVDVQKVGFTLSETGRIPNKDIGEYFVTIPEIILNGDEAKNYELTQPKEDAVSVVITKRVVTVEGLSGVDRRYNKTNIVDIQGGELQNVVDQEDVNIVIPQTGTIENPNIGTWEVDIDEIILEGLDISNYELIQPEKSTILVTIYRAEQPNLEVEPFISSVNGNKSEKENQETEDVEVEIETNDIVRYNDEVEITIKISNNGSGAGYAEKITNIIPDGMEFIKDNEKNIENGWKEIGNNTLETKILSIEDGEENEIEANTSNEPEYREIKLVLRVIDEMKKTETVKNITKIEEIDIEGLPREEHVEEVPDKKPEQEEPPIEENDEKTVIVNRYVYPNNTRSIPDLTGTFNIKTQENVNLNLGTTQSVQVNKDGKRYTATFKGWITDELTNKEIKEKTKVLPDISPNEEVYLSENAKYYALYMYQIITVQDSSGAIIEKDMYIDSNGNEIEGESRIHESNIPDNLEKDGWNNKDEKNQEIWTTDPENPDDKEKWVDPNNPPESDIPIYPVYWKDIVITRYGYKNIKIEPDITKRIYRNLDDSSIKEVKVNLGTAKEESIEVDDVDKKAIPIGWTTKQGIDTEIEVELNSETEIKENTTYYMLYEFPYTITYTKVNGETGTTNQNIRLASNEEVGKVILNIPEEDKQVPDKLKDDWKNKEDENENKIWTITPQDPENSQNWRDLNNPPKESEHIYPVYTKEITVRRYINENNTTLEPELKEEIYRSYEDSTIQPKTFNLGSTENSEINKDEEEYLAVFLGWIDDELETNLEEEKVVSPDKEANSDITLSDNEDYYALYKYRKITIQHETGAIVEQDMYIDSNGNVIKGESRIYNSEVPDDLKKDGWDNKNEDGNGIWTTDKNDVGNEEKWVDPNNPPAANIPIYPVYWKDVTVTRYVYNNIEKGPKLTRRVYRSTEESTIQPAKVNLETTDPITLQVNSEDKQATPIGWTTKQGVESEVEVRLNSEAEVKENTTYYMLYEYPYVITYTKPNGSGGTTSQNIKVASNKEQSKVQMNIPKEDNEVPENLKGEWNNKINESENKIWTIMPNDPENPEGWRDENNVPKESEQIHPVYVKDISVKRYIYPDNTSMPEYTKTIYRSYDEQTIKPLVANMGTTGNINIEVNGEQKQAVPIGWSISQDANSEIDKNLNEEVRFTSNATFYMMYQYQYKITYIKPDTSRGTTTQNNNVSSNGTIGSLKLNIPEEDKIVPENIANEWRNKQNNRGEKVWTIMPNDPENSEGWRDEENLPKESEIIYPVYIKDITVTRYAYPNNTKIEPDFIGNLHRSINQSTIQPASVNLGTSKDISVVVNSKQVQISPKGWSLEPNVKSEIAQELNSTVNLIVDATYYLMYEGTTDIPYVDPSGTKGTAKERIEVGSDSSITKQIEKLPERPLPPSQWGENWGRVGWTDGTDPTGDVINPLDPGDLKLNTELHYTFQRGVILTFNANSASGEVPEEIRETMYKNDSKQINPTIRIPNENTLTKEKYRFLGWSENEKATSATYFPEQEYEFSSSKQLYAIWEYIDVDGPVVSFNPDGNEIWQKSQSTTVNVEDDGVLDEESLMYQWSKDTQGITEESFKEKFTNGQNLIKDTNTGKDWHLWILAKDSVGNTTIKMSKAFYLDNKGPDITNVGVNEEIDTEGGVKISGTAVDIESGIVAYQFSKDGSLTSDSIGWEELETATTDSITKTKIVDTTGSWYFYVKDKLGNLSKKEIVVEDSYFDSLEPTIFVDNSNDWVKNVKVTISYPNIKGLQTTCSRDNGQTYQSYQGGSFSISENTTIIAKSRLGDIEREARLTINNIDNEGPIVSLNITDTTASGSAQDRSSELRAFRWTVEGYCASGEVNYDTNWIDVSDTVGTKKYTYNLYNVWAVGTITWYAKDKLDNVSQISMEINNVDDSNPTITLVSANSEGITNCPACGQSSGLLTCRYEFSDSGSGIANYSKGNYYEIKDKDNLGISGHCEFTEVLDQNSTSGAIEQKFYIHGATTGTTGTIENVSLTDAYGNQSEKLTIPYNF